MEIVLCGRCLNDVSDNQKFCAKCGSHLLDAASLEVKNIKEYGPNSVSININGTDYIYLVSAPIKSGKLEGKKPDGKELAEYLNSLYEKSKSPAAVVQFVKQNLVHGAGGKRYNDSAEDLETEVKTDIDDMDVDIILDTVKEGGLVVTMAGIVYMPCTQEAAEALEESGDIGDFDVEQLVEFFGEAKYAAIDSSVPEILHLFEDEEEFESFLVEMTEEENDETAEQEVRIYK